MFKRTLFGPGVLYVFEHKDGIRKVLVCPEDYENDAILTAFVNQVKRRIKESNRIQLHDALFPLAPFIGVITYPVPRELDDISKIVLRYLRTLNQFASTLFMDGNIRLRKIIIGTRFPSKYLSMPIVGPLEDLYEYRNINPVVVITGRLSYILAGFDVGDHYKIINVQGELKTFIEYFDDLNLSRNPSQIFYDEEGAKIALRDPRIRTRLMFKIWPTIVSLLIIPIARKYVRQDYSL